jgi:plasmid stabilization system protein ParE
MAYKIVWSPGALETFNDIVEYLDKSFTQKEVSKFVGVVNRRLLLLQQLPQSFKTTARKAKRRKTVIHKRAILFYKILERKKRLNYYFSLIPVKIHEGTDFKISFLILLKNKQYKSAIFFQ